MTYYHMLSSRRCQCSKFVLLRGWSLEKYDSYLENSYDSYDAHSVPLSQSSIPPINRNNTRESRSLHFGS